MSRFLHLFWLLVIAGICVLMLFPDLALAQLDTSRIDTKFEELTDIIRKIAWAILGVGVIVIGVKLNNGDHDTRHRAWQFLLGGLVVYLSADIVNWLKN